MEKFVGILGSTVATILACAALNIFKGSGSDWLVVFIGGGVWGALVGLVVAFFGNKLPEIAGAIASCLLMALVIWLISEVPGGLVTSVKEVVVVFAKVAGVGAFAGCGYRLAVLRAPAAQ